MNKESSTQDSRRGFGLAFMGRTIALSFLIAGALSAQTMTTGELAGTVKDPSGAVVPGASVVLTSSDTGAVRSVTTNGSGAYRFTTLAAGNYDVNASTSGLKSTTSKLLVSIGKVGTLDLVVSPKQSTTEVQVTETEAVLQADNPNISSTYSSRQLQNLPMPGGDTTTPAFTVPGIVVSTGGGYGNFVSHGLPGSSNTFTLNGSDNNDPNLNVNNSGASNLTLGANEISEVAVVQNPYSVSYGRSAGAQVNEVTKSGTNQFHGNLVWNWNGDILNANDFFANQARTPRGRANSNQYAASLGGPVIKNKTFFFVDTEGMRYVLPTSTFVAVPSPQFESYVMSQVPASSTALYQQAFNLYNNAPGANRAVPVTTGPGNLQDSSGALGCGSLTGLPNGLGTSVPCALAYNSNVSNGNREWLFTARVDHQITDKQKIFFRFNTDHGVQPTFTDPISSAFNAQSVQPQYGGQVDYTYVISPNIVNHVVGAASWYGAAFVSVNQAAALQAFPTFFQFGGTGGPNGTGGQLTNLGLNVVNYPQGRYNGQGELTDDLSIIKGNHTIKVGVQYRKDKVTDLSPQTETEAGSYLFLDPNDFATGNLASGASFFQQRYSSFLNAHIRLYSLGGYIQDEWAVKSNLKLTLGLRLERNGNPSCVDRCFSNLTAPFTGSPDAASIPYNQSIASGLTNMVPSIEPVVYEPRVGFVWSPSSAKKTVIRGGVGLFSDLFAGGLSSAVFGNAPNINAPNIYTGGVTASAAVPGSAPAASVAANQAFQQGFANGYTLAQIQNAMPAGVPFATPNFFSVPNKLYNPKYLEWSFEIQQQLDNKSSVTVSYVGNHGYDLLLENNLLNGYNANGLPGFGMLPTVAPDPRFTGVTSLQGDGVSNYNGLSVQYARTMGYGFQGQVNYTWSHALDDLSGVPNGAIGNTYSAQTSIQSLLYPYNKSLNYGNSDFDVRNSLNADFTWSLPYKFSNRLINNALGGWTIGSKIYAHTGMPYTPLYNGLAQLVSPNLGGVTTLNYGIQSGLAGTLINPNINFSCTSPNQTCFTSSDFAQNGFGNLARNSFRGPGYFDLDFTASKTFTVRERYHFIIGASLYNMLNHPNFNSPALAINGGGTIQSTVSAPTSAYGSFVGSAVSGRIVVTNATFNF